MSFQYHEQGIPTIHAARAGTVAIVQMVAVRSMTRTESFHSIMKLLTLVAMFLFLCKGLALCPCRHVLIQMASTQWRLPFIKYAARITEGFVHVSTLLLAIC